MINFVPGMCLLNYFVLPVLHVLKLKIYVYLK